MLGVQAVSGGDGASTKSNGIALKQDRITLASFPFSGSLKSVKITLAPYTGNGLETFGTDSWLLAVLVTSPDSHVTVQIGGYHWLGRKDHFYYRHWPDPWLGRLSSGMRWASSRDVSAADLCGEFGDSTAVYGKQRLGDSGSRGKWVVELAMGSNYPRLPTNYTGTLTLLFENEFSCGVNSTCEKTVVRLTANNVASLSPSDARDIYPDKSDIWTSMMHPLIIIGLICLYLLVVSIIRLMRSREIFYKPTVQQPAPGTDCTTLHDPSSTIENSYGSFQA